MAKKIYIQYCRPYKDEDDEPPISEVWSCGNRPKKKLMDSETLFVYDEIEVNGKIEAQNERPWDGIE